jgi:hypothetical protein
MASMSALRWFSVLVLAWSASLALSQQPPSRPAYDGSGAPDVAMQIHVDGTCRILPNLMHPFPGQKPKPFRDSNICHTESATGSEHMEERISGNQLLRSWVRVSEQTYVLQNITNDHIVFVVEFTVPKGWAVDSDPQPNRFDGNVAIFPVHAQPGQIVQLHVGIRRTSPLKPKAISTR